MIHIFGINSTNVSWAWPNLLADELSLEVNCYDTTSLFEEFEKVRDKIQPENIVILLLEDAYPIHSLNFLHNVQDLTFRLELKTIILNVVDLQYGNKINPIRYPNLIPSYGSLYNVSLGEIKDIDEFVDQRLYKLCKSNHVKLTSKLVHSIQNDMPINLNQGFNREIVNKETINWPSWWERL